MGARSKARKRALDALYAADLRGEDATGAEAALAVEAADGEGPPNPYTLTLVRGVAEHQVEIDELLATYSTSWTLPRMPAVDRNVLRLGVYELMWADDVPGTVAISEAMALVRELSTDESPPFVNGLLGRIQDQKAATA